MTKKDEIPGKAIFPVWKRELSFLMEEPTKYIPVLTGAIGVGKSRAAIIGLCYVIYAELIIHGPLGRTIFGFIFIVLGFLIIILKKEKVYYSFLVASFLTLLKMIYGLIEAEFKFVEIIARDIIIFFFFIIIVYITYIWNLKSKNC